MNEDDERRVIVMVEPRRWTIGVAWDFREISIQIPVFTLNILRTREDADQ